ncbi:MAG: hypothetical protein NTW58_09980 [Actinobacteria bacterium]|nr:hypothetical protein [Actinomycetota bacterium]
MFDAAREQVRVMAFVRLGRRLNAGANVVTSIVPPTVGLAGVSQVRPEVRA